MKEPVRKRRPGQSGAADSSAYVRQDRIEIRVNHNEKKRIEQLSIERNFETTAQYVRCQAMNPGAENPSANRQAQQACMHQLHRLGTNINQIARHLNAGNPVDGQILLELATIAKQAESLLRLADAGQGAAA